MQGARHQSADKRRRKILPPSVDEVYRQLARIAAPIWLYVVVTGWIVYGMLYLR